MTMKSPGGFKTRHWPRRRVLAGVAGTAASVAVTSGAQAQFDFNVGGFDLGGIFSAAKSLFEGISLGEEDEIKIGVALYPQMIADFGGAYKNSKVQSAMRLFADPLIRTTARPNLPWEIVVLDDNTVNAWALPGGKLAVNKGLIHYTASDHELAAVIAHEIGHVEKSHALEEMRSGKFTSFLTEAGAQVIRSQVESGAETFMTDMVLDALSSGIFKLVTSGYSRSAELEADAHLLRVFELAGYDPKQASGFYLTLLQLIPPDAEGSTSLFSTHPETLERADRLDELSVGLPSPRFKASSRGYAYLKRIFPTREYFRRNPDYSRS
ncbi:MAG: M48 family metalloprotease [Proteobacteria bacterium]|nr:M48 family metalloprotease [Pseudomonadota bacterium]